MEIFKKGDKVVFDLGQDPKDLVVWTVTCGMFIKGTETYVQLDGYYGDVNVKLLKKVKTNE